MKKLLVKLTAPLLIALGLLLPAAVVVPATAVAQSDKVCEGISITDESGECDDDGEGFKGLIRTVINVFSIVVGAISVIMIIIGGFRYIISGGDSNGVTGAKNTIMYAIIGLVIVLFAQVIVRFVFSQTQQ